jgi:hypothetical protein
MITLKEALAKVTEVSADAAIDPTACDPRVRAGVEAKVRNANQDLERVSKEYKDILMSSVVVIGVKGKTASEFAQSAQKAGAVTVDFNLIVDRLTENLSKRAAGPIYTSHVHFMLLDELSKIRLEYDIVQLPTPQINTYVDGIYDAPLAIAIKKLLTKNYGTSLQSAVTRREIGKLGLAAGFAGKKLPVILYNLDEDVDVKFIPNPVTTLTSDGKVTDNAVKKKLSEVKNMLIEKKEDSQTNGQSAQTQEEV